MKKEKIFWGVFLILAAILMLVSKLGFLQEIGVWSMFITVFLVAFILKSAVSGRRHFGGIFFPLAFLGMIYARPLGIEELVPWALLAAALLLTIGFNILFPPKWKKNYSCGRENWEDYVNVTDCEDSDRIAYEVAFGSSIKYVNSSSFRAAALSCSFGSLVVYFDNAVMQDKEAVIKMDNAFGKTKLFIPRSWVVEERIDDAFSHVNIVGRPDADAAHRIIITGSNAFGSTEIVYN